MTSKKPQGVNLTALLTAMVLVYGSWILVDLGKWVAHLLRTH